MACVVSLASSAWALAPEDAQSSGKAPQETQAQAQQSSEQARAAQGEGEKTTPLSASQKKVLEDWEKVEQMQQHVP